MGGGAPTQCISPQGTTSARKTIRYVCKREDSLSRLAIVTKGVKAKVLKTAIPNILADLSSAKIFGIAVVDGGYVRL